MKTSPYPLVAADEAAQIVLRYTPVLGTELLPLAECAGRVIAEDLIAPDRLPRWPVSAVDGYAVRSADGSGSRQLVGESAAGRPFDRPLPGGATVRILTGGVVPDGADAVAMQEEVEEVGSQVLFAKAVEAGSNVHQPGADIEFEERALPAGTELGAAEIGIAGALGFPQLQVHRRPRVGLMSTGDELVEVGQGGGKGTVPDSNRFALMAALQEAGAEVRMLGIGPDEAEALRRLVTDALKGVDVLVTSGGVSVGTHDLVKPLLESLGEVHIGRVKLKPGKPFTFATLGGPKLAFGLPGFPVSSLVTFEVFVRPALRKMQGFSELWRPTLPVRLGYQAHAAGDRTEYQRVTLRREGGDLVAYSTGSQSSSRLLSLVGAHALVRVPPGGTGIAKGSVAEAMILRLPAAGIK